MASTAGGQQTVAPSRPMTAESTRAQPAAAPSRAPQPVVAAKPAERVSAATPLAGLIDIQADDLSYDAARRLVIARGEVKVTRGTDSVAADYAEIDTARERVFARGNIVIQYLGNTWKGEEATYDFKTSTGDFGAFEAYVPPYHVTARESRRRSPSLMELEGVMLTTCEPDNPEYSVRASSATLEDGKILRAKHLRFQLGPVPFFWMPYVKANVEELAKFEFTPGASSAMGVFLLTAYKQPINDVFKTRTHLDVREKRGLGVGEDLLWKDPAGGTYDGMLRLYYADDQRPWHKDSQRAAREGQVDGDRYWLHLNDRHNLTDLDYLITELNYLSDFWVLSDFFDDLYQENVQPENRVTLSHRGKDYMAGVGLNMRLNDFYGNVDRLPQVFLNFNRQPILDTPFYYEGDNTLSFLDRVFPESYDRDSYDAFRFDTKHMAYWPTRHFGFLSLMPRAGYRGTYYSKTQVLTSYTNVVAMTNALGVSTGVAQVASVATNDGDAVWRNLPEIGAETSFKAFGELYTGPTGIEEDMGLRHVAEPYANYTMAFEPNVLPEELWQFDAVDALDERHDVLVGMRNYLQTKRKSSVHNLLFANVFATLLLDPDEDENEETLGDVGFKTELRPWSWFSWDFDGSYDTQTNSLRTFNTQARVESKDNFIFSVDYRYSRDSSEAVAGDLTVFPEQRWSGRVYARMDMEAEEIDEHSYYLIHRTRCLGIGLGLRIRPAAEGSDEDDDYTVWFRFWPLALPEFYSALGG
ncbi:MAG: LPS-assembly protein LptD [Kiritimatiellia bacterium]